MDILILATSAKNSGYCVAGLDLESNRLIRLVSDDEISNFALSKRDITYNNGSICKALDVVSIDNLVYSPTDRQHENYKIDNSNYPVFQYKEFIDENIYNFLNKRNIIEQQTYTFMGSRKHFLYEDEMNNFGKSLAVYFANKIEIYQENNKSKADIFINENIYTKISVTDFDYFYEEDKTLTNVLLVCSLPDKPWDKLGPNMYFKFIAKIIEINDLENIHKIPDRHLYGGRPPYGCHR